MVVYENPYARILLTREIFIGAYDERYGPDKDHIVRVFAGAEIEKLEKETCWRKARRGDAPEGRFREREMILRFFALADRFHQYAGGLKQLLNEYMGKYALTRKVI